MENWKELFGGGDYLPRGDALLWQPSMIALHTVSDFFIGVAFLLIPLAMLRFLRLRRDLPENSRRLAGFFMLFIAACGVTHLADTVTIWVPVYWLHGLLKAVTASLSIATAVVMWPLIPQILRLPSPSRLQSEIDAHLRTMDELRGTQRELEERVETRTKELREAKSRFETALRNSPISIATQDRDLRYTWAHNLPDGLEPETVIGKTDENGLIPADVATKVIALKHSAMESDSARSWEVMIDRRGRPHWFDLLIEPLHDDQGIVGVTTVAVDITQRKQSEEQLRVLLRELTHRSKNLLAVIQSIARRTAARTTSIEQFLDQFGARLVAIGSAHDLLVAEDWKGASLKTLIESQLSGFGDLIGTRIALDGEDIHLKPEATQNIAMALHELASNAAKFGALSNDAGKVGIAWSIQDGEAQTFVFGWKEQGGPDVTPPGHVGFGRMMIERVVGQALNGKVKLDFEPDGVSYVIEIPATHVV